MLDPVFAALTTQIAAVEQALPRERIAEIVNGSFRQLPVARRTLDLVTQAPGCSPRRIRRPRRLWQVCCFASTRLERGLSDRRVAHTAAGCGSCCSARRPGGSALHAVAVSLPGADSVIVAGTPAACRQGPVRARTANDAGST